MSLSLHFSPCRSASLIVRAPQFERLSSLASVGHSRQRDYLGARLPILDGEERDGAVWLAAAVSGAARIEQQQIVVVFQVGNVAMPEDHYTRRRKLTPGVTCVVGAIPQDMDDTDSAATYHQLALDRQHGDDLGVLHIALHSLYRSIRRELIERRACRVIARVDDELDIGEALERGIGDARSMTG